MEIVGYVALGMITLHYGHHAWKDDKDKIGFILLSIVGVIEILIAVMLLFSEL